MPCAARLLWSPGVDHQCAPPGPAEHQRGTQPGGAAADDDAIPRIRHATELAGAARSAKIYLPCRQKMTPRRRRPPGPATAPRAAHRSAGLTWRRWRRARRHRRLDAQPARVGQAQAGARPSAAAGRRAVGQHRRPAAQHAEEPDPRVRGALAHPQRRDVLAADPPRPRRRPARVQDPGLARNAEPHRPSYPCTTARTGSTCCPAACG